ncbi:MAG: hypothetical protein ACKV2Q_27090 [Planctomycetaceae bacterium]
MRRFRLFLIVFATIVISLGFYRGWFALSGSREAVSHKVDVNLSVDTEKVKADAESVKDKAKELTGKPTEKVGVGDNVKAIDP